MWAISSLAASAATPACAPLDEAEFRSFVLDAQSAVDRGDVELPAAILAELDRRLPCLTFAPQPRMWADLLVMRAIVEFSRGGPWEDALAAALRIRPAIDRGVGAGHPMAAWEPPAPPPGGPPVPDGVQLFVDGLRSPTLPPSEGLYLVQKTDGRFWNTVVLRDADLPFAWVTAEVDQPPRVAVWGRVGAVLGTGSALQTNDWGSDWYDNHTTSGLALGLAGDLHATFYSPFGVLAHGRISSMADSPGLDARAAAIWTWRGLTLGAGAGLVSVDTFQDTGPDRVARFTMERYPLGTAMLRARKGFRVDAALTVGATQALGVADLGVGWLLADRVRVGIDAVTIAARYVEEGFPERDVTAGSARVLLRIDWVRGEY